MFQTCAVNTVNIDAHSSPSCDVGKSAMKSHALISKNPRTGTDCNISIMGSSIFSARLDFAAHVPNISVTINEAIIAISIRTTLRRPKYGKFMTSRLIFGSMLARGACISLIDHATSRTNPSTREIARRSHVLSHRVRKSFFEKILNKVARR